MDLGKVTLAVGGLFVLGVVGVVLSGTPMEVDSTFVIDGLTMQMPSELVVLEEAAVVAAPTGKQDLKAAIQVLPVESPAELVVDVSESAAEYEASLVRELAHQNGAACAGGY